MTPGNLRSIMETTFPRRPDTPYTTHPSERWEGVDVLITIKIQMFLKAYLQNQSLQPLDRPIDNHTPAPKQITKPLLIVEGVYRGDPALTIKCVFGFDSWLVLGSPRVEVQRKCSQVLIPCSPDSVILFISQIQSPKTEQIQTCSR